MRRSLFIAAALALAAVAAIAVIWQAATRPTTLRVAVGPPFSENVRIVAALGRALARDRAGYRLKPVVVNDAAAAAKALDAGLADLAVSRTDVGMAETGAVAVVLRRNAAVLIAPAGGPVKTLADFAGRRIGVVRGEAPNLALLKVLLRQGEIDLDSVSVRPLTPAQLGPALVAGEIDAALVVDAPAGDLVSDATLAFTHAGQAPHFIGMLDAEAIAQRNPSLQVIEVVRGVFGGAPPKPSETFSTVAATTVLSASRTLDEQLVAGFVEALFAARARAVADAPSARLIEAPDTDKGAALAVHPGAAAFYDGERKTFFDRYGDWIYLVLIGGSVLGSGLAGLVGLGAERRRREIAALLLELGRLQGEARAADAEALARIDRRADKILAQTLDSAADGLLGEATLAAFRLAFDELRRTVETRRAALEAGGAPSAARLRAVGAV